MNNYVILLFVSCFSSMGNESHETALPCSNSMHAVTWCQNAWNPNRTPKIRHNSPDSFLFWGL